MATKLNLELYNELDGRQLVKASVTPSVIVSLDLGSQIYVLLDGNITISNPVPNLSYGSIVSFFFKQDATGNRTVSWGTAFRGISTFNLNSSANGFSNIRFIADGAGGFDLIGQASETIDARLVQSAFGQLSAGLTFHSVNASAGALSPLFATYSAYQVNLDANATINAAATNPATGTEITLLFVQDSTGYRTVTLDSSFSAGFAGQTIPFLARKGPGLISSIRFLWNGSTYTLIGFDGIDLRGPVKTTDYGTTSTTDGTIAMQNMVNDGLADIIVPRGQSVHLSSPVLVNPNNVTIRGEDRYSSLVIGDGFFGGPFVFTPSYSGITTTTALATGSGAAWKTDGSTSTFFLGLQESYQLNFNGKSAFTWDQFIRIDGDTGHGATLISCSGSRTQGSSVPGTTFQAGWAGVDVANGTLLTGDLEINGANVGWTSGSLKLSANVVHHVAVTYDGTNIMVFVDGALGNTINAPGTITQEDYKCWEIGASCSTMFDNGDTGGSPNAAMDSIRLSDSARWTSAFTKPTAKSAFDANTVFLHNFDNEQGQFSIAKTRSANNVTGVNHWLLVRRNDELIFRGGGGLSNLTVQDNYGVGVQCRWSTDMKISDVNFNCPFVLQDNCYKSTMTGCTFSISTGGRSGLQLGNACGVFYGSDIFVTGGKYQIAIFNSGCTLDSIKVALNADAVVGMYVNGSIVEMTGWSIDDEANAPNWLGSLLVSSSDLINRGGVFDQRTMTAPCVIVNAATTRNVAFFGSTFYSKTNSQELFHQMDQAIANPVNTYGCFREYPALTAPWSNTVGLVNNF